MEKKVFVQEMRVKDEITTTFVVKHIALMEARDGRNYLNVILSDNTGDIESRKWNDAKEIFSIIKRGDHVFAQGKINLYQNKLQFIVTKINKIDLSSINEKDYIPSSALSSDVMFDDLIVLIDEVKDVYIKDLLQNILFDHEINKRIKRWSAAKNIHHAYQGGLLEHILSSAKLAKLLSKHYNVNSDFVLAGAILHDLGKIYELNDGPIFDYTEEGRLIGHVVKVIEIVDRFILKVTNFPKDTRIHLKHILLSHHGELAYGSPKTPMTAEAFLVHYIDLIDSKMNSIEDLKKNDVVQGHWTGYVKHLDRVIYKKDLPTYKSFDENLKSDIKNEFKEPRKHDKNLTHSMKDKLKNFKID